MCLFLAKARPFIAIHINNINYITGIQNDHAMPNNKCVYFIKSIYRKNVRLVH